MSSPPRAQPTGDRYRVLLFDADGTLFDYERGEARALEQTLSPLPTPTSVDPIAAYREINAAYWRRFEAGETTLDELRIGRFADLTERCGWDLDPAALSATYVTHLSQATDLLPHAVETVDQLGERFRLALITNGLADVQRARLAASPFAEAFEAVAISDELQVAKPDRRIFDTTLAAMGHSRREDVLMIGDSLSSDIQGAHNAGVDSCWLRSEAPATPPEPQPTFEVRSLQELVERLTA